MLLCFALKGFGRRSWTIFGLAALGLLLYAALTAKGGVPDPGEESNLSHGAVVLNSGLLVLREGLEAILVGKIGRASCRERV